MRIGLVTRLGLAEALRTAFQSQLARGLIVTLVVIAIGVGNAAYEAGNLIGAVLGAGELLPVTKPLLLLGIAGSAALLLASGHYRTLETVLSGLVALMAAVFGITAVAVLPEYGDRTSSTATGADYTLTAIALIGTTVVPYNLFLQASAVQQRWPATLAVAGALREARADTFIAIGLGGLVTLSIMSTAAVAFFGNDTALNAATLASQLEPTLGTLAGPAFAGGLLAAGLTSAITAPLAAAWALCGALGWSTELKAPGFRAIWAGVLGFGTLVALLDINPIAAILLAQAANGLLLPVVAVLLLWMANQQSLLDRARNGWLANTIGASVVLAVTLLGGYRLWGAFTT